jgi:hypothetical protein
MLQHLLRLFIPAPLRVLLPRHVFRGAHSLWAPSRFAIGALAGESGFGGERENTAERQDLVESLSVSSEEEADAGQPRFFGAGPNMLVRSASDSKDPGALFASSMPALAF